MDLLAVHCHTGWARNCHKHAKCQSCRMVQTDGVTVKVFDYRNPRRPVEIWRKRCLPCGKLLLSKRTVSEHEFRKKHTYLLSKRRGPQSLRFYCEKYELTQGGDSAAPASCVCMSRVWPCCPVSVSVFSYVISDVNNLVSLTILEMFRVRINKNNNML